MKMRKLFFILAVAAALILTSCSGPGDSEMFGSGSGGDGGGGMFSSSGRNGGGGMFGSGGNNGGGGMFGGGGSGGGNSVAKPGSLTINGFPSEYNGKYVQAGAGYTTTTGEWIVFFAYQDLGVGLSGTNAKIVNGSVTLKVWAYYDRGLAGYNGNDKNVDFVVKILNGEFDDDNYTNLDGWVTVNFSGGKATGTYRKTH